MTTRSSPDVIRSVKCTRCGQNRLALNGPYLRWLRERAGLSLRTVAKRLHLSAAYLSDIERNQRACPARVEVAYNSFKRKERAA